MSVAPAAGVLGLAALRQRAAALLEPSTPTDPGVMSNLIVLADVPDAIDPPVLLILWRADPWLEPHTSCTFTAQLTVMAVAGRIDPAPGIEDLEALVTHTTQRLHRDPYPWGGATVSAPQQQPIGNLVYLAAEITYRVTVTTEED